MIGHSIELVVVNVLFWCVGLGLLGALGIARSVGELRRLAPLGYAVGLATCGNAAADLAVVHVAVGRLTLPVLALGALVLGWRRIATQPTTSRPASEPRRTSRTIRTLLVALPFVGIAVMFGFLLRLLAVKPLVEFDGWVIWATRARALYEFGYPASPVFTDPTYPALQHPLLLPSLEAIDFRFMGAFDGTVVHLQLFGFALALVGAAWTLLRSRTAPVVLAVTLLAIVAAPTFLYQLPSNYADVPLACFVALGVCGLAGWVRSGERDLLVTTAIFLGAAVLTKSEGEAFALAAFVAAAVAAPAVRRRELVRPAVAVVLIDLPWRLWVAIHGVKSTDYRVSDVLSPSYLADHANRVWPAIRELCIQMAGRGSFGYLLPLVGVALAGAIALRGYRTVTFAAVWIVLSFAALVITYWVSDNPLTSNLFNSSDRTIDSIVFGAALLVPVLVTRERDANGAHEHPSG